MSDRHFISKAAWVWPFLLLASLRIGAGNGGQDLPKIEVLPTIGHTSAVTSVAFSPRCFRVLSGSYDNPLRLWDPATGALVRTFEGHTQEDRSSLGAVMRLVLRASPQVVYSVAFSPDCLRVLAGSYDRTLNLWDSATGKLIRTFE